MIMEDSLEIDLTGLVIPERIEITRESDDGSRGDFVIEPLERGFRPHSGEFGASSVTGIP